MPVVLITLALAVGIWTAHGYWHVGPSPCASSFWLMWQRAEWVRRALFVAPFLPLPLVWHLYRTRRRLWLGMLPLYALLGGLLYSASPFYPCLSPDHVAYWAQPGRLGKHRVLITGVVDGWPDRRERFTFYRVRAETLRVQSKTVPVNGWVRVKAPHYPEYEYGDRVRVVGVLDVPPVFEDFDYRRYLAQKRIYAVVRAERVIPISREGGHPFWRTLYAIRRRSAQILDVELPAPYSALAQGILLGIEGNIPRSLYDDFNATGTSHIIVISGFNIAIVTGLLLALLGPLMGIRGAALAAILGVGLYVIFVGADAAVMRAGIMGGVYAFSLVIRRRPHVLNTLFFAALVMLSLDPLSLWNVGFQLSFLATLGLIVVAPLIQRPVHRQLERVLPPSWQGPVVQFVDEAVVLTLAAQVATMPLVVGVFGRASLISPISNMLILPVQPLVMVAAGVSTVLGWVWLPLGRVVALLAWLPLAWTVWVVEVTARWPGAGIATPSWTRPLVVGYYALFAMFVAWQYARLLGKSFSTRWQFPRLLHVRMATVIWPVVIVAGVGAVWTGWQWVGSWDDHVLHLRSGEAVWQLPRGVRVRFWGRGEEGQALMAEDSADAAVWVVLYTDVLSLVRVRQAMQDHPPQLLVMPALCVEVDPCPSSVRFFLQTVEAWGVRWIALTPYSPVYLGNRATWLEYLPDGNHDVHPVLLHAGSMFFLLPPDVPVAWQDAWAEQVAWPSPLILPLPLPERGTWPTPRFLRVTRPERVLIPLGVTYPPESQQAVAALNGWTYDPERELVVRVSASGEIRR